MLRCVMTTTRERIIAGIFVGGRSSRMGGQPKGLLELTPGLTLVGRWRALFQRLGIACVLVGESGAYTGERVPAIADADAAGPLGGLLALLAHAGERVAVAVACDMPFVSDALVARLVDAPPTPALVARRAGRWEPFFARYDARAIRPLAEAAARSGARSLQAILDAVGARELPLSPEEAAQLDDWDTPADARRPRGAS
jgi:molybdopterin-guanine dinucleotide biosynthesis protein A